MENYSDIASSSTILFTSNMLLIAGLSWLWTGRQNAHVSFLFTVSVFFPSSVLFMAALLISASKASGATGLFIVAGISEILALGAFSVFVYFYYRNRACSTEEMQSIAIRKKRKK